jgi:hypothetical protein
LFPLAGLWVSTNVDNIRNLFPLTNLSIEVWFTIQSYEDDLGDAMIGGGLLSAISGYALTYFARKQ